MAPPDSLAHAHTTPPTSTPSMPSTFSNPPRPPAFPSCPLAPTQHLSNITDPAHLSSFGTVSEGKYSSYSRVPDAKRSRSRDRSPPRSATNPLQKAMQTLWYDSVSTVGRGENNHWKRFLQNGPNTQGLSHLQQQWLRDFPIYEESKDLTTWLSDLETRLPSAWDVWAKVSILHQRLNAKHQHLFAGALDRLTRRRDDLTWEEIRQAFIFSLKGRATSLLLEQRMRRINQRDGEPFRTYIGRAYDELVKVIGTRPNDDQLTRVVVAGANISTARQIQHYRNDAATLWDLQELVEEWEHREWRLLGLPDPFHDPTRAVPGGAERQESAALAAQSTPLDRDLQCGWCSKVGHHENGCSQPMYCDQCVEQTHPKKDCTKYRQRLFNVHNERHAQVALAHPRVMQALQTPAVPTAVTQPDTGATLAPTSSLATLSTSAQDRRPSRRNWQDQKKRFQNHRNDRRPRSPDRYHPRDIRRNPPDNGRWRERSRQGNKESTGRTREPRAMVQCARCGRPNHVTAECRTIQCTHCRRFGHSAEKCYSRNAVVQQKLQQERNPQVQIHWAQQQQQQQADSAAMQQQIDSLFRMVSTQQTPAASASAQSSGSTTSQQSNTAPYNPFLTPPQRQGRG